MTYKEVDQLFSNKETLLLGLQQLALKFNFKIITDLNKEDLDSITPGIYATTTKHNFMNHNPNYKLFTDSMKDWKKFKSTNWGRFLDSFNYYCLHKVTRIDIKPDYLVIDKVLSHNDFLMTINDFFSKDYLNAFLMKRHIFYNTSVERLSSFSMTNSLYQIKRMLDEGKLFSVKPYKENNG